MTQELRPITEAEIVPFLRAADAAFGQHPTPTDLEANARLLERERSLAVVEDGEIVATAGAFSLRLTLPGGARVPVAGVTGVGVLPTARRRGHLTRLMRRQLDDVRARGEPLAALTASESVIYGRFGYGVASTFLNLAIGRAHTRLAHLPPSDGSVGFITHAEALDLLPPLYDQVAARQPGAVSRSQAFWEGLLRNAETPEDGAGPRFYVVARDGRGQVAGAAYYRVRMHWEEGLPLSTVKLEEVFAATPDANAVLWHHCLSLDLVAEVRALRRPWDEPLFWMLADPRRLRVTSQRDDLWLRLLDVPAALAARRYATEGQLVLQVADGFMAHAGGRYRLEGGPAGATCTATTAEPDVALDVADLGAAYLGGVSFAVLARARRVHELRSGALARADALFHVAPAPFCGTPF